MELKNKKNIIMILILALAILIIQPTSTESNQSSDHCKPNASKPILLSNETRNVASEDFRSLVRIAGYLKFAEDSFMTIGNSPNSINQIEFADNWRRLNIITDCVEIHIPILGETSDEFLALEGIKILQPDGRFAGCFLDIPDLSLKFPPSKHYSFAKHSHYKCYKWVEEHDHLVPKEVVAEIVLEELEFEIYGNETIIKEGNFSKPVFVPENQ